MVTPRAGLWGARRAAAGNQSLSEWLTAKGIRHTWVQTPGQHSFRVWRRYLAEFVPLLFQDKRQK
jgi:enterochelin esterase-like enzyme